MEDLEREKMRMQLWVMRLATITLSTVMMSVVAVLLIGVFLPNEQIDNKDILAIINPAFNTIIGAFVGCLATLMGMKTKELDPNVKTQEIDYDSRPPSGGSSKNKDDDDDDEDHGPF